ncbi:MAG: S-methyl-5-thioribose-1-phosphate isomerase [Lachnospiraceae bacterium]|nr:S-methyl-5-thioribose-1-phosphate isomerase [Lachnospiraceae bacterium]
MDQEHRKDIGKEIAEMENSTLNDFFEKVITVKWGPEKKSVDIIDQTLLPGEVRRIQLKNLEEMVEAIKKLRVRGAPAIGVCAAYSMAVLAQRMPEQNFETFYNEFLCAEEELAASRPTAVNLFWALHRMDEVCNANREQQVAEIKRLLLAEAEAIREEDVQISRNIGEIGFQLLEERKQEGEELGILTHCNAGTLATAKYGTATAPMYIALEHGWQGRDMHVYCDETRPLLQGARLTSFELVNAGITTSVQCDNMAALLLRTGRVKIIFVGCDRVATNGDAANKIGTSGLAILARHYGVPFYVCAPSSTIDPKVETGEGIPIEMRDPEEIKSMWYRKDMVPEEVDASFNPAFDVTDHSLITGIITEKGLCTAPYREAFQKLGLLSS